MGCSSSSAQTVDQEKRPGTKPEEGNGETLVRNGSIAENTETIADQMHLPMQSALPDDFQPGAVDEAEAVLTALETQEGLGSGEDLLATAEPKAQPEPQPEPEPQVEPEPEPQVEPKPELQPEPEPQAEPEPQVEPELQPEPEPEPQAEPEPEQEPVAAEKPVPEAPCGPVGAVVGPTVAVAEVEPVVPVEEVGAAEVVVDLVCPELQASVELKVESVVLQREPLVGMEEAATVPAETPGEAAAPVEAVAPVETTALTEAEAPVDVGEPVIDVEIAAATVPEIPPVLHVTVETSAMAPPAAEETKETPVVPAETASPAETWSPTEAASAPAPQAISVEPLKEADTPASVPAVTETPAEVVPAPIEVGPVTAPEATNDSVAVAPVGESIQANPAAASVTTVSSDPGLALAAEPEGEVAVSGEEASQQTANDQANKEA